MADQIDELQLDISVKAHKTAERLDAISKAINNLTKALSGLEKYSKTLDKMSNIRVPKSVSNATVSVSRSVGTQLKTQEISDNAETTANLAQIQGEAQRLSDTISSQINIINEDTYAVERLRIAIGHLDGTYNLSGESAREAAEAFGYAGDEAEDSGKKAKKGESGWSKFMRSLRRIALYRVVRSVIKSITDSLREGLQNYAQYDKATNTAMSDLNNSVNQLKNTVGVTAGQLMQTLAPVLIQITNLAVELFDSINMALASLQGKDTYSKAIKQNEDYAKSLKKVNSQLLSFDKFETLSGGDQQTDPASLFEEVAIPEELNETASMFKEIFEIMGQIWEIAQDIFEALKPLALPMMDLMSSVLDLASVILDILMPAINSVADFIGGIVQQISGAVRIISGILKLLTGDFEGAWESIGKGFASMVNGVANMFIALGSFIMRMVNLLFVKSNPLFWVLKAFGVDVGSKFDNWISSWASFKVNWQPYANGGMVKQGTGFLAGEAGAEAVWHSSAGTGVTNISQFRQAMVEAIYECQDVFQQSPSPVILQVDGKDIAQSKRFKQEMNRQNIFTLNDAIRSKVWFA